MNRPDTARLIGKPRRALDAGAPDLAEAARAKGAVVTRANESSAPSTTRFDLIVFGHSVESLSDVELERMLAMLEDGGHVVAPHSAATAQRFVRAGLALLMPRPETAIAKLAPGAFSTPALMVARRPPQPRKLSLTVGMISMNEAGAVGRVIDDIRAHVPQATILLVDSSKDETPAIAEARGARVVRQFPPRGYGPAMTRLLYEADTDVIVTMDCDGTYPADKIPRMLELVEQGADLVNATRTRRWPRAMPLPNYVANRIFAGAAHVVHGIPTTDVHSGMRAYRTSMLRGIDVEATGRALPVELLIAPARFGYRVAELEIPYFERVGTSTLQRFDDTVWTFRRLLRPQAGRRVGRGEVEML